MSFLIFVQYICAIHLLYCKACKACKACKRLIEAGLFACLEVCDSMPTRILPSRGPLLWT